MTKASIVHSVFDFAIREINALEHRIAKSEDDADSMLWEQARQVVAQLDAGLKQDDLAKQWINRDGKAYSQAHVSYTAKVFRNKYTYKPRPRFRDAYNEVANRKPMDIHYSSETPEHYTPPEVLRAVKLVFGDIPDLDPCSNTGTPNVEAKAHYTIEDNGLEQPWSGRVFVNPPYGRELPDWITKVRSEWGSDRVEEVIALVPSRTDTEWFETLTGNTTDAVICFLSGRLTFVGNEDPAPFPSMVVYFGPKQNVFARVFGEHGTLWLCPPLDWFVDQRS